MKKAMVYGAGVSGLAACELLRKNGYEVILVDDKKGLSSKEAMTQLNGIELFIKSPGIPYNELVLEVKNKEIELIDEIELAYRYSVGKFKIIAVTGTNGKTTTTTLLIKLLSADTKIRKSFESNTIHAITTGILKGDGDLGVFEYGIRNKSYGT